MKGRGEERGMEGASGREGFKGWACSHCQAASKRGRGRERERERERKRERCAQAGRQTEERVCANWDE